MNELLPCPFCGGPAKIYKSRKFPIPFASWEYDISCVRGCTSPFGYKDSPEDLALLWNQRWLPPADDAKRSVMGAG